ncbi:DsbA family protein [Photobacterium aphoticum]|uniref:Thioredoxin n=1 Tax=Photobacterium aphoticum TaxID=754436 RepID=A0A0J1JFL3_9GAMM|nr:DsbA family protein [Photobacterium aphoticum]KLV00562.1 thioredoxin [Photobacterium aphoticum]
MKQQTKQAMKPALRIDFFHDVICGWCYVLSPRLRQLATEFDLDIHHHAFALTATRADQIDKFGSVEQAKSIIMGHWEQCAKADDAQRINVAGMRAQSFDYPISTPGLVACKAAAQQPGEKGAQATYWDYFDAITHAHLHENRNIADEDVLVAVAEEIGLDGTRFRQDMADPQRQQEIAQDKALAEAYGVNSTPTLVINQQWAIPGAVSLVQLREAMTEIQASIQ